MSDGPDIAWYCVKAQTKREHIAAGHLRELEGVEVFCPRLRYRKATRRGKIWWVEPMFPGYLMAKFDLQTQERAIMFCQGVRGLVRFGDKIPPVPDDFVTMLRDEILQREKAEGDVLTLNTVIDVGEEVEVAVGPFQGMRGQVVAVAPAAERVKVLLEFLGQQNAIDLDLFSILLPRRPMP
ncbi:MAG: transcriptional activator RfaH [Verrucomicrobiales bacterium VVV1]|nr:MAG: transcriptional activator RfaH [Verrucomicrobiales bacterium VVV1]